MRDAYDREVTGTRLSVTQRCNLRCFYCHAEGQSENSQEMGIPEIEAILNAASSLGIKELKLTGGEPLVRQDIVDIVSCASRYMTETSMTTNGVLLTEYAGGLKKAGLARVNVNLPSLDPHTYQSITGEAFLSRVIDGINEVVELGFALLKINMVMLKGMNEGEIESIARFCYEHNAILQLIEFEQCRERTDEGLYPQYHVDLTPWESMLREKAIKIEVRQLHHRKKYFLPFGKGNLIVEVVKSMHNSEFCRNCHRLRVTSDGYIKPCLWTSDGLQNIAQLMEKEDSSAVRDVFIQGIKQRKPYWV